MFLAYALAGVFALFLAWRRLPETKPAVVQGTTQRITWSRPWVLLLIIFLQEKLGAGVETLAWAYFPSGLVWALLVVCFAVGDPAEQAPVADLTGYDRRGRAYGFYANSLLLALCALILALFLRLPAGRPSDYVAAESLP